MVTLTLATTSAQRKIVKKAKQQKEIQAPADPRIESMTASTQKVMFIDSIVTDKNTFLQKYRLNSEAGSLHKYDELFSNATGTNSYVHINEMGNKCYYPLGDTTQMRLYTSDMLDGQWTEPTELDGIYDADRFHSLNFPFVMADGTTLYFAARGSESIGGYDIFVTRFDSETGTYLKPENIGMPFNSEANDYMYAIDELDSIGWFVTDRNQPEGKVCIYIFLPSDTRRTYQDSGYTDEQITSLARINRIADTWDNKTARSAALQRLRNITSEQKSNTGTNRMRFIINDRTIYTSVSDFRSKQNAERYEQLQSTKANLNALGKALDKARNYYATANGDERRELKDEIIKSEKQYESLEKQIRQTEKEIRNSENKLIK